MRLSAHEVTGQTQEQVSPFTTNLSGHVKDGHTQLDFVASTMKFPGQVKLHSSELLPLLTLTGTLRGGVLGFLCSRSAYARKPMR